MADSVIKVLLVDDEEDDYIIAKHRFRDFEHSDYELEWECEYDKALKCMIEGKYDLFLLDYRLDNRNGLDLLKEAIEGGCDRPTILLTGQGDLDIDVEAMKAGASDYLIKHNLTSSLLERSIRYALERFKHINSLKERENDLKNLLQFKGFVTDISTRFINLATDEIDEAISQALISTCKYAGADRCYIYLQSENKKSVVQKVFWSKNRGLKDEMLPKWQISKWPWVIARLMESELVQVNELSSEKEVSEDEKQFLREIHMESFILVPLCLQGDFFGFMGLDSASEKPSWSEGQAALIKMVAEILTQALERKRVEEELIDAKEAAQEASRIKSEFLSNMSHELRTPLNSIIGMSDLISSTSLDEDQKKYVDVFRKAGNALSGIINDILDFSGLESNRFCLNLTNVHLENVLKEVIEKATQDIEEKGLHVSYKIDESVSAEIKADHGRLTQVLKHLLGNAVKFTMKGDIHIDVCCDDNDEHALQFSVSDTGIGIPGNKIDHIFSGFVQGDSSLTRRYGGTGLGLTISKRIVELMEGDIWVESKEGQGTTFYFTIKLVEEEQDTSEEIIEQIQYEESSSNKVLLVDDAEEMRKIMEAYFKMMSFEVVIAKNGQEAVSKFRVEDFDVVFMDIRMPVMDGLQATREIRQYEEKEQKVRTPVIALTSYSMKDEAKYSLDAGCDLHLVKPVMKKPLLEALEKFGLSPGVSQNESNGKITVHIDPELKSLIPGYLKKRSNDLQNIMEALDHGDFKLIRDIGHKLKGSGGGYGFDGLSSIGESLEMASRQKDEVAVKKWHSELNTYLEKIDVTYDGVAS